MHAQTFENEFKKEAKILETLNHPHIVRMIRSKVTDDDIGTLERTQSGESKKSNNSNNSSNDEKDTNCAKIEFS